ncbi:MAG: CapA family protein [Candidatus Nomurabacteria bacterium]|nr:CapA family protein [Candidatus Nomurabacteria bacterium]
MKSSHKIAIIVPSIILVVVAGVCLTTIPRISKNIVGSMAESPGTPDSNPTPESGQTKLLLAGTTFWGRNTNKMARASNLGVKYPFSGLYTLDRGEYDAWIAGLECPLTLNGHTDYNENTLLKFNCDPDYLPEAAKWFTALSLGNNHTDNWGTAGFATTKEYLQDSNVQYFGHYDYKNTQEICSPIIVPSRVNYSDGTERILQIPIGFCGLHGVFGIPTEAAFQEIRKISQILPTIVMPHMGKEYEPEADALRTNLYHKMIDYGADMVIGDHPHWIQNAEAYKGKLIVYSMGNFMFDQLWSAEVVRSAAISAAATFDETVDYEAWDEISEGCLKHRSTCLNEITNTNLPRLQPSWSFNYRGTTTASTRITRLADPVEQTAIGNRLNWVNTMKNLK